MKPEIVLDGAAFNDLAGFYDEVERKLTRDLGWRMGRNLDALNDVLRGGFGVFDYGQPARLAWAHAAKSRADLGYPATVAHWTAVLTSCHPTNRPVVRQKLAAAAQQLGPTLFEELVRMVREHDLGHLTLELR